MVRKVARVHVARPLVVASVLVLGVAAQNKPEQKPAPQIKRAAAAPIQSVDGKDNFDAYCAVCHGMDAKGTGPAAPAMKVPVPDLTRIAQRNKGKFNPVQVEEIIRFGGKTSTPAHGVETMPMWGEVFRSEPRERSLLRIANLVKYLESIQVPAGRI